jgi:hypothetical protein
LLRRRNVIQVSEDSRLGGSRLTFGEPLLAVASDAQLVVSEQIRRNYVNRFPISSLWMMSLWMM